MKRLLRIAALLDGLGARIGKAVSWLILVMVLIGAYNALARYGGRYVGVELSSNSLLEAQWYLFSVVFLLCAPWTLKVDEHVRVDVFYGRLSKRGKAWVNLLGAVALLVPFSLLAIVFSWPGIIESWEIREQSPDPGGLPRYPLKSVVLVAFVLLIIQGLSEILKQVVELTAKERSASKAGDVDAGSNH